MKRPKIEARDRGRVIGSVVAALTLALASASAYPHLARADKDDIPFDITPGQFAEDCKMAGGAFQDLGEGDYLCAYDDWMMGCSEKTDLCIIACDPGTPCVGDEAGGGTGTSPVRPQERVDEREPVRAAETSSDAVCPGGPGQLGGDSPASGSRIQPVAADEGEEERSS